MLRATFRHLDGIGEKTEKDLWEAGITTWEDLEHIHRYEQLAFLPDVTTSPIRKALTQSRVALREGDADFFAERLPGPEHYRIALSYPARTMFLDIETTGLSKYYDHITLVGWCMGRNFDFHLRGDDHYRLEAAFREAIALVTFNGALFDLPFLREKYPSLQIPTTNIDLRFLVRQLGLSGGQKDIEKKLEIRRADELAAINGRTAPSLWYRYLRGDMEALRLLIKYNYADVVGMQRILDLILAEFNREGRLPPHSQPLHQFAGEKPAPENRGLGSSTPVKSGRLRPYSGPPPSTMRDLAPSNRLPCERFVGIDLTGSETRPSGYCVLQQGIASTKMIHSDAEIVQSVLSDAPALVSIDSPLSLPKGRVQVSDDGPGRETFGIMRECERTLKKRGVNVYPCLIKSMQDLTARGIRLADALRSLGIPVIESFPGAAQDVMHIPRKGTDVSLLKQGLADFGIRGDYLEELVTHDELDAITCSVVGFFFWIGKFEALGNDDEEYLIIPDLSETAAKWAHLRVVGISGRLSAGKTTAGRVLETLGFHYTRFSLVLERILRSRGITPDRDALQDFGRQVHRDPGQRWLCRQLVDQLPDTGSIVIDGLRHPQDHAFMVESFGPRFTHLFIDSPTEARLGRYVPARGSLQDFLKAEQHSAEKNIWQLLGLAHRVLDNSASLEEFDQSIRKLGQKIAREMKT